MGNTKGLINIKNKKYHYVYCVINTINSNKYIGRHSTNNLNDGYLGSGKNQLKEISKYGRENFKKMIIKYLSSYEESMIYEKIAANKEWCDQSNTLNIIIGGSNPVMYDKNNPSWKGGVSKDPNYKKRGPYDFSGENNPRFGYKYTTEEKKKMVKSQKTRIKVIVDGKKFDSKRDCARYFKMSRSSVSYRFKSKKFPNWKIL